MFMVGDRTKLVDFSHINDKYSSHKEFIFMLSAVFYNEKHVTRKFS